MTKRTTGTFHLRAITLQFSCNQRTKIKIQPSTRKKPPDNPPKLFNSPHALSKAPKDPNNPNYNVSTF